MPNWCYNSCRIYRSQDDGGVTYLYDLIRKWQDDVPEAESFKRDRLPWLVEHGLGIDLDKVEYNCRGSYSEIEITPDEENLEFTTETAWGPLHEVWIDLIREYIPGAKFTYTSEEPGCAIYLSNDPDFKDKFNIDSWGDSIDTVFCGDEDDVIDVYEQMFKEKPASDMSMDDIIDKINNTYDKYAVTINRWAYDSWDGYVA